MKPDVFSQHKHDPIRSHFQEAAIERRLWASCINCIAFNQHDGKCLVYNASPPPKVIVMACNQWQADIPF